MLSLSSVLLARQASPRLQVLLVDDAEAVRAAGTFILSVFLEVFLHHFTQQVTLAVELSGKELPLVYRGGFGFLAVRVERRLARYPRDLREFEIKDRPWQFRDLDVPSHTLRLN